MIFKVDLYLDARKSEKGKIWRVVGFFGVVSREYIIKRTIFAINAENKLKRQNLGLMRVFLASVHPDPLIDL